MKNIRKIALIVFFLGFFCMPVISSQAASDFTIESYHVDMKVTKQNTYQITEKIDVFFHEQRHGIYRDIPLTNKVKRQDGSENRIQAKMENVFCSEDYEISRESNMCRLKIGDADETIIGSKTYTISYDYIMGNDCLPNEDELYFNIIGTQWQTYIKNVTFAIHMPEEFDEKNLGMSYGSYGEANTDGLYYHIEDNTIYGKLDSSIELQPYQGVNVRLVLPEGYYEQVDSFPVLPFVAIAIGGIALVLAFVFWYLYGRDDPVVETTEFYPPDGLNSLEMAFAYKGSVNNNDAVSLLICLAQKGYLKIRENGKKDFQIEKVRDYDGNKESEKVFFQGLFSGRTIVTKSSLQNSFYKTINNVKAVVDNREEKRKIFYANSLNKSWIIWVITLVAYLFCLVKPVGEYEFSFGFGFGLAIAAWCLTTIAFTFLFMPQGNIFVRILMFLVLMAAQLFLYIFLFDSIFAVEGSWYRFAFWGITVATGVAMFFCAYMSKRTPYGTQILGKIRGFRNFLETAEKERLEALVEENPQYFYHILPYTYVLDLSSKWMKKFESIAIEPPHWYDGNNYAAFNIITFNHFINSTMTQATTSMTSTPSSSSGGGFSGGGSGGGGGGSW